MKSWTLAAMATAMATLLLTVGCGAPAPKVTPSPTTAPPAEMPRKPGDVLNPPTIVSPAVPVARPDHSAAEKALQERIDALDRQIDVLNKKIETLGEKADAASKNELNTLRDQRAKLNDTWNSLKASAADAWEKTKDATANALDALDKQVKALEEKLRS